MSIFKASSHAFKPLFKFLLSFRVQVSNVMHNTFDLKAISKKISNMFRPCCTGFHQVTKIFQRTDTGDAIQSHRLQVDNLLRRQSYFLAANSHNVPNAFTLAEYPPVIYPNFHFLSIHRPQPADFTTVAARLNKLGDDVGVAV